MHCWNLDVAKELDEAEDKNFGYVGFKKEVVFLLSEFFIIKFVV